jgi:hypothetical protein
MSKIRSLPCRNPHAAFVVRVQARKPRTAQKEAEVGDFVLVYRGGSMPETEAEQAKVKDAWTQWFGQLGGALKDGGNPFTPQAKTISSDGSVADGGTSPPASGYSIITSDSLDEATNLAKGCPVLGGGASIEIYETFPVM